MCKSGRRKKNPWHGQRRRRIWSFIAQLMAILPLLTHITAKSYLCPKLLRKLLIRAEDSIARDLFHTSIDACATIRSDLYFKVPKISSNHPTDEGTFNQLQSGRSGIALLRVRTMSCRNTGIPRAMLLWFRCDVSRRRLSRIGLWVSNSRLTHNQSTEFWTRGWLDLRCVRIVHARLDESRFDGHSASWLMRSRLRGNLLNLKWKITASDVRDERASVEEKRWGGPQVWVWVRAW